MKASVNLPFTYHDDWNLGSVSDAILVAVFCNVGKH